jgi:hypothetical protein
MGWRGAASMGLPRTRFRSQRCIIFNLQYFTIHDVIMA